MRRAAGPADRHRSRGHEERSGPPAGPVAVRVRVGACGMVRGLCRTRISVQSDPRAVGSQRNETSWMLSRVQLVKSKKGSNIWPTTES